jgi:hypothetical protein
MGFGFLGGGFDGGVLSRVIMVRWMQQSLSKSHWTVSDRASPFLQDVQGPKKRNKKKTHRSLLWRSASENKFSQSSDTCSTPPPPPRLPFVFAGDERFTSCSNTTLLSPSPFLEWWWCCCCRGGVRERGRRLCLMFVVEEGAGAGGAAGEPPSLPLLVGEGLIPSKV